MERVEGKHGGGFCGVHDCGEARHRLQGHVALPALLSARPLYFGLVVNVGFLPFRTGVRAANVCST